MKKKENDGLLWGCIGIITLLYFIIQVLDVIIDEVFRKSYFKNINFNESLIFIFFFIIILNIIYMVFLAYIYIPRFPNSKLFSNYSWTILSIFITSTFQTFFVEKIFDSDLSMLLFALIINILIQSYFSFFEIENKANKLNDTLSWNRDRIFRVAIKNSKITSNLPVDYNEVFKENYFLIKLSNCNLTVYKNSTDIIFKCYNKTLTKEELLNNKDIQPNWELNFDFKKYGFVIDNFIDLLEDEYRLTKINTKDKNTLIGFLTKN